MMILEGKETYEDTMVMHVYLRTREIEMVCNAVKKTMSMM